MSFEITLADLADGLTRFANWLHNLAGYTNEHQGDNQHRCHLEDAKFADGKIEASQGRITVDNTEDNPVTLRQPALDDDERVAACHNLNALVIRLARKCKIDKGAPRATANLCGRQA